MSNILNLDLARKVKSPKIILANRNKSKLGQIRNIDEVVYEPALNSYDALSFKVYKKLNGVEYKLWDDIISFKLIWVKDYNTWFQIIVSIDEFDSTIKNVTATSLCEVELSQTNLNDLEINTSIDIARDDYTAPTVFYNPNNASISLLNRVLDKMPSYSIKHVDTSLMQIQRSFSANGVTIYDFLTSTVAKELDCLFLFDSTDRTISVYDIETVCLTCGYRGVYKDICPKCGSTNLIKPYGKDTTIFVTAQNLANNDIQLTPDDSSLKNCFRLISDDENINALIPQLNPNGSRYYYYFNEDTMKDMPSELIDKLNSYNALNDEYENTTIYNLDSTKVTNYNTIIDKVKTIYPDTTYLHIPENFTGYSNLVQGYRDTIDFSSYLEHSMMPTVSQSDTSASEQLALLTTNNLSPVAVQKLDYLSIATADSAIINMAKVIINSGIYKLEIVSSSLVSQIWRGKFKLTNYSDETDTATNTNDIVITINDNYIEYVNQNISKAFNKANATGLKELSDIEDITEFKNELKKYSLARLSSYESGYQTAIDILAEENIASKDSNLYDTLYIPYYDRLSAIQSEMVIRQKDIDVVSTLEAEISNQIILVQNALNFQNYLGVDLYKLFSTYRREQDYSNSNYISTGLTNAEIISKTQELIEVCNRELKKAGELSYSITTTLNNLLVMKEFEVLVDIFELGNYIRVKIDNSIYKMRLIDYKITYNKLDSIEVTFSDVTKLNSIVNRQSDLINQIKSMSSSFGAITNQAKNGSESYKTLDNWVQKGLDATMGIYNNADNQTQVFNEHGFLSRQKDDITGEYTDEQLKIINTGIAITKDKFKSIETAIGKFKYVDPITDDIKDAFGVNAKVVMGVLLLGEQLGIYNTGGSMQFTEEGLTIKSADGKKIFKLTPNQVTDLIKYTNNGVDQLYIDSNGNINIGGNAKVGGQITVGGNNNINGSVTVLNSNGNVVGTFDKDGIILADGVIESANYYPDLFGLKIDLSNGTWDSKNTKIDENGTIVCHNFISNNASITGGTIDINTSSKGYSAIILSSGEFESKSAPEGLHYFNGEIDSASLMQAGGWWLYNDNGVNYNTVGYLVNADGRSYLNVGGGYIDGDLYVSGNLMVSSTSTKNKVVETENYGTLKQYCVESATPVFSDFGKGIINQDGLCYIDIDLKFRETVNIFDDYHVMLTAYGEGNLHVENTTKEYFIVKGTPNMKFSWEIKMQQKCIFNERLEEYIKFEEKEEFNYLIDANKYLENYESEVMY